MRLTTSYFRIVNRLSHQIAFVVFMLLPHVAAANFAVTGELEGVFCRGWIFERCEFKRIDAVSDSHDGQLFTFAEQFESVDDYNEQQGRCWIRDHENDSRIASWLAYLFPSWFASWFYAHQETADGAWQYLGQPDYITFQCTKSD